MTCPHSLVHRLVASPLGLGVVIVLYGRFAAASGGL